MRTITKTSPFVGAEICYSRAYRLLAWMGQNGHVTTIKRNGKPIACTPSEEMAQFVTALNKGDEETIKFFLVHPGYSDIVHAA